MNKRNINVTVLFFANLRDLVGEKKISLELLEEVSVADLKRQLAHQYPRLEPHLGTVLTSINHEFAFDEDQIPDGAEIALFPPVSGGSGSEYPTYYAVTENEININQLLSRITSPSTGAAGIFTGMVRAITARGEGHETQYLEYEAYQSMAEGKMEQVAGEIRSRWPTIEGIAIVQRIGRIYPGTPTVMIACTAAHRDTGVFEAARYGIDRLKEIVPVWKKEVGPLGEVWIEGEYTPTPQD